MKLTDLSTWADAQEHFSPERLWDLLDGTPERLNLAHECVDRHAGDPDRVALRIALADGGDETIRFRELADASSRFANLLLARGVEKGDRVAIMLEPSLAFYVCLFGAMKAGAIAVPLFTLFGPDGLRLRVDDCTPRILVTNREKLDTAAGIAGLDILVADDGLMEALGDHAPEFTPTTRASDMAMFQYTSGTTRELPDAVRHTHKAIVTVMIAALYGTGIRPGDRYFCPSSPAWGHGLWHGTLAPLAMGITTGAYAGRFDAERLLKALQDYEITNLSAAATHYRMMKNSGAAERYTYQLEKLSYTGEPIDPETLDFIDRVFRKPVCSIYGTTEVGVILVSYPGAADFPVKPGSLGKAVPGTRVEVHDAEDKPCPPGTIGEIKVWRRDAWFPTKDLGYTDEDGYFYHAGRADDVIISAGWTMSAVEIENQLLKHPDVQEAAVIGVPDETRGQVVKAFLVSKRPRTDAFVRELQTFVRERLSQHEYPRLIDIVAELPKTPAGKVNRKVLRDREREAAEAAQR
ncbi:acyl-CoA synthetase [Futiania mangrovi]|uniref:Acyl-CoA synthetase n=1 Tax=Futiania mangrovi TaxID=2959716 RepID=A0A9J6PF07_9PROT|nr:acyl-CoA synthetase [Futiania mangrovii]MCP1337030.1 acyl-CoA synthetase [Futiania mangrovii]